MRTAVLTKDGFEIREMETPTIADDEVLVRTLACGICSGDVFVYRNRAELAATHSRLGHEATGRIVAVGRHATGFQPGDVVTSLSLPAYADFFVARPDQLVTLPSGIDPINALGEAVACCVHAANRFGTRPDDKVAVIGCGFMGLICLQLAKHQGAGLICAVDPVAERRQMAKHMGAQISYDPLVDDATTILSAHGEFDVVIEATGVQSAVDLCTDLVAQHGRIVLVGYHQSNGGLRTVNMEQWNFKAIDVVNGHVRRQDEKLEAMRLGMDLMRQGHIVTAPLVTVFDLDQVEQAFQALTNGTPGLYKAVLHMDTK